MDIEKPFATYEEVQSHALKLRLLSETAALRFGNHCHALADKEVRTTLLKGAVSDAVHDIKPLRSAAQLMTSGGITSQVLMGLVTRKGGLMRRLITSVAAVVLPNLLAKVPWARITSKATGMLGHEHEPRDNGYSHN